VFGNLIAFPPREDRLHAAFRAEQSDLTGGQFADNSAAFRAEQQDEFFFFRLLT
jgi:hypothetical protein